VQHGSGGSQGRLRVLLLSHGVPSPTFVEQSVRGAARVVGNGGRGSLSARGHRSRVASGRACDGVCLRHGVAHPIREASTGGRHESRHPVYGSMRSLHAGGFDEGSQLKRGHELNWRLRRDGATLIFDPSILSTYRPRRSLVGLARQSGGNGRWKARVCPTAPALAAAAAHRAAPGGRVSHGRHLLWS